MQDLHGYKECASNVKKILMFLLSNVILLRSVRSSSLMSDATVFVETLKYILDKL